ncbi:hypothetical protein V1477_014880 [Vespula maculifrons]|uniref:Uncharacterized protein n=1 Tax=Vespula maculifrons TaxID=7453 RepID=A0ABD2BIQ4_VESMC
MGHRVCRQRATVATAAAAVAEVAAAVAVAAAAATTAAAAAAAAATVNDLEMMILPERRGEREMETKRKDELIVGSKTDSKRGREGEEGGGGGGGGAGDCGETNKLHRGHLIFAVSTGDELSRCDDNLNYRSDEVVKKIASTRRNVRNLFCGKAS